MTRPTFDDGLVPGYISEQSPQRGARQAGDVPIGVVESVDEDWAVQVPGVVVTRDELRVVARYYVEIAHYLDYECRIEGHASSAAQQIRAHVDRQLNRIRDALGSEWFTRATQAFQERLDRQIDFDEGFKTLGDSESMFDLGILDFDEHTYRITGERRVTVSFYCRDDGCIARLIQKPGDPQWRLFATPCICPVHEGRIPGLRDGSALRTDQLLVGKEREPGEEG